MTRRYFVYLFMLFILLLSACGTIVSPTTTPTLTPTLITTPTFTSTPTITFTPELIAGTDVPVTLNGARLRVSRIEATRGASTIQLWLWVEVNQGAILSV